jgi:hypothetical protein
MDHLMLFRLNITMLDGNKRLSPDNAESIPMIGLAKMVIEVENLNNESPATVFRCPIDCIYVRD